jgi:hypothetical protein
MEKGSDCKSNLCSEAYFGSAHIGILFQTQTKVSYNEDIVDRGCKAAKDKTAPMMVVKRQTTKSSAKL